MAYVTARSAGPAAWSHRLSRICTGDVIVLAPGTNGVLGDMKDGQGLTQLIGEIYDAALDSSRWTSVLANVAAFAGGQAAGLLSKDSVSKSGNIHYQSGVDPYYVRLYSETYWQFDPVAALPDRDIEQIVSVSDLVRYDEFKAGRFYREWAHPQGWVDAANAVLARDDPDSQERRRRQGEPRIGAGSL